MRTVSKTLGLIAATVIGSSAILADNRADSSPEFSAPEFEHLDFLVGSWKVEQKHLDASGSVIATAEGTEEITWVLDKHAIQRVYRTTTASTAFEAIGLLTWSAKAKKFEGAWFDNVPTAGSMRATGEWNQKDRTFVFQLEPLSGDGGDVSYKTIDRFETDTSRMAVTYQVKGSEITKISEVKYTRTTPCPAKLRMIFDN